MTPLPAFTIDPTTNIYDVVGDLLADELRQRPLNGAAVTFTNNLPETDFIVWEGELNRIRRTVTARVASDGTILFKDKPVQLLANDPGLNVEGIQWQVSIQPRTGKPMTPWWFDAPGDGDTVDLSVSAHASAAEAIGVPVPPTWDSVTGKPDVVAAGDTQAEARAAISAQQADPDLTAIASLTSATNTLPYYTGAGTAALTALTSAGRALLDDTDAAAQRTTLGALGLVQAAKNPDLLITGAITRNVNDAVTSAAVTWPDGTPGTFTADTLSAAFPGAIDAYNITYGSPVTKTYTQPTITRNSNGAATNVPAIVVT